jgi:hypothetical protein
MTRTNTNLRILLVGMLAVAGVAGTASASMFEITIENLSPNVLSPAPFITHDASFDIFDAGAPSPMPIERIAEDGQAEFLLTQADDALGMGVSDYELAGAGPLMQGESATITLDTDMSHPYLSFASMMGISNDGFIGWAMGDGALDLFPGGSPLMGEYIIMPADVWDAATEENTESAEHVRALGAPVDAGIEENGLLFLPHAGILGIADIPIERDWTGGPVARVTITPEPASLALLALGGLTVLRRRR